MMNVIKNIFHSSKQTGFLLMVIICLFMQVQTARAADTWQQTGGPEGGPINVLAIDPSNSQTVYAGISDGGVFKTTNGGVSWTAMNNGLTDTNVFFMAIDPSNSQVVYAGTRGKGVFKTIAETSPTLYGSFTGNGIWQWGGSGWTQLTPDNPESIVAAGSNLYGKFANGIWQWNGSAWTQLTPDNPALMAVGE